MTAGANIDRDILSYHCGGDAALEQELLGLFIVQAQSLQTALAASHPLQLEDDLHRMKGAARALGAVSVAEATETMEGALGGAETEGFARAALVAALEDACTYAASLMPPGKRIGLAKSAESR